MVKQSVEKPAEERSVWPYRGVRKRKWGKYVSEIRLPNSRQRIWLGSYDSPEKAARAFDAAMFCLRGSSAKFNFPSDPPNIDGGRNLTPSQIQIAAAQFANLEPRKESSGHAVESITSDEETTSSSLALDLPSLSLSDITVQNDAKYLNGSFPDLFSDFGSDNYAPELSNFLGFEDFTSDFFVPELAGFDYEEQNLDGLIIQDSFLWNF